MRLNEINMTKYEIGSIGWLKEKAKEHGFGEDIKKYIEWARHNGELPTITEINRKEMLNTIKNAGCKDLKEYQNLCAKNRGYHDKAESTREWRHYKGIHFPMLDNETCSYYVGIMGEREIGRIILPRILGTITEEMPPNYPGFDFIVDNNIKVNVKSACLIDIGKNMKSRWCYNIDYNEIADYFLCVAFDNREHLYCMHVWLFKRDDIVRKKEIYKTSGFSITNLYIYLTGFKNYEVTDKLSEEERHCKEK